MHLETLGQFRLLDTRDGDVLLTSGKPLALLAYLALSGRRSATREQLIDLLWGNLGPENARQTLRQAIHVLRTKLGPDVLIIEGATIAIAAHITSDRDDFLAALDRRQPTVAMDLHRGPMLGDIAFPGAGGFAKWLDVERTRLSEHWATAGEELGTIAIEEGRIVDALMLARRVRDALPDRESAWRLLLHAYTAKGDALSARLEADGLTKRLRDAGRTPEPATQRMIARTQLHDDHAPFAPIAGRLLTTDLVGREAEFGRALRTWRLATRGDGTALHIRGAAGVGKSRLMEAIAERIHESNGACVLVRASASERALPLAFAAQLVSALASVPGAQGIDPGTAAGLVALAPILQARFPAVPLALRRTIEPHVLALAIGELITTLVEEKPLAVLIDDLHWVDVESSRVIAAALSRAPARLAVITAGRGACELEGLRTEDLLLAPLGEGSIAAIIHGLGELDSEPTERLAAQLMMATGGYPLLIIEALRILLDAGSISLHGRVWTVGSTEETDAVLGRSSPIDARLSALLAAELAVLTTLALAGRPLTVALLERASDRLTDREQMLYSLEAKGLVQRSGGAWELAHDQYAEAMIDRMSVEMARTQHRQLATAMLDEPDRLTPGTLKHAAIHAAASGDAALAATVAQRWVAAARAHGDKRPARMLLRALGQESGARYDWAKMASMLPWRERPLPRTAFRGAMAVAVLGVVLALVGAIRSRRSLSLVEAPAFDLADVGDVHVLRAADLKVVRADGSLDTAAIGTVSISKVDGKSRLYGVTSVPITHGRARFDDLTLTVPLDSAMVLRFESSRYGAVVTDRIWLTDKRPGNRLWIVGGALNGQKLAPDAPAIHVAPGDSIRGHVVLQYTSRWRAASVMLCAANSWSRKGEDVKNLIPLATPADSNIRIQPLEFVAPRSKGAHYIVLAFQAERDCDFVFSQTNWTAGKPNWSDGPDLMELTEADIETAQRTGALTRPQLRSPQGYLPGTFYVQVIRVIVE